MSLGLEIRTIGRASRPITAVEVRDLTETDLMALGEERGIKPLPLKRLSERHHALARTLAAGTPSGEAALCVGLTPSRVSILIDDPAFQELVSFYRSNVDAAWVGMQETLAGLSHDAALVLRDRLEENSDDFTVNQLLEVVKTGADRTGHGPSSKQEHSFSEGIAAKMQEARERANARKRAEVLEIIPNVG